MTERVGNLIISLRQGEAVKIGDALVRLLWISSARQIKISIAAPVDVAITRQQDDRRSA